MTGSNESRSDERASIATGWLLAYGPHGSNYRWTYERTVAVGHNHKWQIYNTHFQLVLQVFLALMIVQMRYSIPYKSYETFK